MELSKLTFSVLFNESRRENLFSLLEDLRKAFGEISLLSEEFSFQFLERYYGKEMGTPLKKVYLSIGGLVEKSRMVEVKRISRELEEKYSEGGRRTLNVDPGFVDESQLILLSHKRRGARVYLAEGVYAEIELLYVYGAFRPLYWTYRDYRHPEVRKFFERVRKEYLRERKQR